jgi:NHLM bacteriocin system ABC transporter peptidase/ATP-binding protein
MEETECGAAALKMVLGHFGSFVPIEELRATCRVSRDGATALNIVQAAREYGLETTGRQADAAQLRDLPMPAIVFWRRRHFLVVEGFRRGRVHLNDPAGGRRAIPEDEFAAAYSGVALTFAPGPDFQRRTDGREHFLRELAAPLATSRAAIALAATAGLALVVPTLIASFVAGMFVQQILAEHRDDLLGELLVLMALAVVLTIALTVLQQQALLRLQIRLALRMTTDFVWHLLRLPVTFFDQRQPGLLVNRVSINGQLAQLLAGEAATAATNIVAALVYGAVMIVISPPLAAVSIVLALVNVAVLRAVARRRVDGSQQVLTLQTRLGGRSIHGLGAIETIKARGDEASFFRTLSGLQAAQLNAEQQVGVPTNVLNALPQLLTLLNTVAVLGLGGLLVIDGHLQLGPLVSFQILSAGFLAPVNALSGIAAQLQTAHAQLTQLDDVRRSPVDPHAPGGGAEGALATPPRGRLELRDVRFGYLPGGEPLIDGLSLTMEPGARVALVGTTGSGKSTVGNLVAGLYEPWSGEILFDGRPREAYTRRAFTTGVAKVDQSIFLFDGTVADNLRLWDETLARAALVQAARDAAIHDELVTRSGGYDAAVAEGGRNFSGGQAQRLEIARALAGDPALLILDEATSALDTETEERIDQALRRRGISCLIIAHRLSTIRDCDEILVLREGAVVQRGRHDELYEAGGPYRELIDA